MNSASASAGQSILTRKMPTRPLIAVLMSIFLMLTGCQAKEEFWINPDGSGKVTIDLTGLVKGGQIGAMGEADELFARSLGVRQWSDVSWIPNGNEYSLHATAYFDDVNELQLGWLMPLKPKVTRANGKIIGIRFDLEDRLKHFPNKPGPPKMSVEAIRKKAHELSTRLPGIWTSDEAKARLEAEQLDQSKIEYIVHFPGRAQDLNNLQSTPDGALRLLFVGPDYFEAYKSMISNEVLLGRIIANSEDQQLFYSARSFDQSTPITKEILIEKMWGRPGGIHAIIVDDPKHPAATPLFDYRTETATHDMEFAKVLEKGGMLWPTPEPTQENQIASIHAGQEPGLPNDPYWRFRVIGEMTAKPYAFMPGIINRAADDRGAVMPGPQATRFIRVYPAPELDSQQDSGTHFRFSFQVPKDRAALKEISGVFQYMAADSAQETDVGEVDFKTGGKSSILGFAFEELFKKEVDANPSKDHFHIIADIDLDPQVKATQIKIYDLADHLLLRWDIDPSKPYKRYILSGNSTADPEKVRVKVMTLKNPRVVDVGFHLKDMNVN